MKAYSVGGFQPLDHESMLMARGLVRRNHRHSLPLDQEKGVDKRSFCAMTKE